MKLVLKVRPTIQCARTYAELLVRSGSGSRYASYGANPNLMLAMVLINAINSKLLCKTISSFMRPDPVVIVQHLYVIIQ